VTYFKVTVFVYIKGLFKIKNDSLIAEIKEVSSRLAGWKPLKIASSQCHREGLLCTAGL